ncbi:MAG: hypothetical protein ACE37F_32110 [Nannocystaceae bacterium]|nr:hypothetical protein [bacterium]
MRRFMTAAVLLPLGCSTPAETTDEAPTNTSEQTTGGTRGDAQTGSTSGVAGTTHSETSGRDSHGADGSTGMTETPEDGLYTDAIDTIIVEVDYESGAQPETGNRVGFGAVWDVFETNAEALFSENPKTLVVDREPGDQQDIGALDAESFTASDLRALADEHRDAVPTEGTRTYYVLWVDGTYADDSGPRPSVLGVSVGDNVIGMFKPTLRNGGGLFVDLLEQAVLVHEFGHASGLVNAGVPLQSDHQDEENGRHCTNEDCVMYWALDGVESALDQVLASVVAPDTVLWGELCLDDVRAAAQ